jgi:NAD(P)-dependent dehydrogenase (short-subunit alcohol dehydrogenase family)
MEFGLQGKAILITGAASGIGRATALAFAKAGSSLGLIDIDAKGLKACAEEAQEAGSKVIEVVSDLSTENGVKTAMSEAIDSLDGRADVLVNNVGVCKARAFDESTDQDWLALFNLNFMSSVRACRAALPIMRGQENGGVIVNNTSDLARQPEDVMLDYACLKAALLVLTKGLARAEGPKIRINAVAPGPIWTPLWTSPGGLAEGFSEVHKLPLKEAVERELTLRKLPLRRLGKPEEVANVILFLASDLASFVTSSIWGVDGGSIRNIV